MWLEGHEDDDRSSHSYFYFENTLCLLQENTVYSKINIHYSTAMYWAF